MAPHDLLLRVARLSHEARMTNEEIAKLLFEDKTLKSDSPRRVQELVDEAGVWLLDQHESYQEKERDRKELRDLEAKLCERYELLDARVVPGGDTHGAAEYAALMRRHGRAAAQYFDEVSSDAEEDNNRQLYVAMSGGQSILDMVSSLPERRRTNVHFYAAAMIGRGTHTTTAHIGPETNASVAWSRSGRVPRHLFYGTVPPYSFRDEDLKGIPKKELHSWAAEEIRKQVEAFATKPSIKSVLDVTFEQVNMAVAGLGLIRPGKTDADYGSGHVERITMTNLLRPFCIDLEQLAEEGVCGELSYCMFDRKGKGNPHWKFFLTPGEGTPYAGVEFYRRLVDQGSKVMVIAGERKWEALVPAINTRLFNVLVTDARTANRLLIG